MLQVGGFRLGRVRLSLAGFPDEDGQKPIHAACQNNYSEVAKLFLQQHPSLVMATTKDGNTCAHIAAAQGSVTVVEELMKFDRQVLVVLMLPI